MENSKLKFYLRNASKIKKEYTFKLEKTIDNRFVLTIEKFNLLYLFPICLSGLSFMYNNYSLQYNYLL